MQRRADEGGWGGCPPTRTAAWKRLLLSAYLVAAGTVGTLLVAQAVNDTQTTISASGPSDVVVDHLAAKAFMDHYNPFSPEGAVRSGLSAYGPAGNAHPPTTSFWLLPFADWDLKMVQVLFGWGTLFVMLIEIAGLVIALQSPAPLVTTWLLFGYLAGSPLTAYHMYAGQFSGSIGMLFFAGWLAARKRQDELAGVALGLAASMKLFPAVAVLPFLFARRWRVVTYSAATFVLIAATMASQFGWRAWPFFFKQQHEAAAFWMGSIQNGSIHGIVQRIFMPACTAGSGTAGPAAKIVSLALCILLVGFALRWSWPFLRKHIVPDVTYASFVMLSTLSSEFTWEHYTLIFLLPLAVAVMTLLNLRRTAHTPRGRAWALGGLLVVGAVAAAWRQNIALKSVLQRAYFAGNHSVHFRLHVREVLCWLPNVALLGLLLFLTDVTRRQATSPPTN